MSEKSSSCFGKLLKGCGCATLLALLLVSAGVLVTILNRPTEPEIQTLNLEETLHDAEGDGLAVRGSGADIKPIRLVVATNMAHVDVLPDGEPGRIKIEGEYDSANFELETRLVEKQNWIEYRVDFANKKFLGFYDDNEHQSNILRLHLPRNTPMRFDWQLAMGSADVDLSGIPMLGLHADLSMGEFAFRMNEPNLLKADEMRVAMNMGDLQIQDIQNFGFSKSSFKMSMGETRLTNSGPFREDTELDLKVSMGQILFQIPENSRLQVKEKSLFGEYLGPRSLHAAENAPLVRLNGKVTMGAIQIETGTSRRLIAPVMMETILNENVEMAIKRYHELRKDQSYRIPKHALRGLGYRLLELGRAEDAVKIFKLNIHEGQAGAKDYHALAHGYRELGNRERALESLEIALEIDPNYGPALRLKKRLEK